MVEVNVAYLGDLRTEVIHGPSQSRLCTDAPVDNCGKGELFSPTDLVGAALGSCVLTILGIYAQKHHLSVTGATAVVRKEMTAHPVRRIAKLTTELRIPLAAGGPHCEAIERAILSCPVHASLHPEMEKPIHFYWLGEPSAGEI
ncbi:MAG: OsmC family peroxiredoxin [Verrucomicrobia bacterium]|nr:OsmC family peroxiredoxin [Verrucomicrobiota bacterium]